MSGILLGLVISTASAAWAAAPLDYYLDVQFVESGGDVTVNGFPVFSSGSKSAGFSTWLTPYLRGGENQVELRFRANPESLNPRCEFAVVSHPHDGQQRNPELQKALASGVIEPRSLTWLTDTPEGRFEVLAGSLDPANGLVFAETPDGWHEFGARILDEKALVSGRPLGIDYVALSQPLRDVSIHFVRHHRPGRLKYDGLSWPRGIREAALDPRYLREGMGWLEGASFDTIWIRGRVVGREAGDAGEVREAVRIQSCKIHGLLQARHITREFKVEGETKWAWQRGADVATALDDPALRQSLVAHLAEVHRTIDSEPADRWLPLFEEKTSTYAAAMQQDIEATRKSQLQFFEKLANTEGWGLQPFRADHLQLVPVNRHAVRVSYPDSEGPVVSLPLERPNATEPNRFTIPLYLALIDGKWRIVL